MCLSPIFQDVGKVLLLWHNFVETFIIPKCFLKKFVKIIESCTNSYLHSWMWSFTLSIPSLSKSGDALHLQLMIQLYVQHAFVYGRS